MSYGALQLFSLLVLYLPLSIGSIFILLAEVPLLSKLGLVGIYRELMRAAAR
jgi:hypothetical protein